MLKFVPFPFSGENDPGRQASCRQRHRRHRAHDSLGRYRLDLHRTSSLPMLTVVYHKLTFGKGRLGSGDHAEMVQDGNTTYDSDSGGIDGRHGYAPPRQRHHVSHAH